MEYYNRPRTHATQAEVNLLSIIYSVTNISYQYIQYHRTRTSYQTTYYYTPTYLSPPRPYHNTHPNLPLHTRYPPPTQPTLLRPHHHQPATTLLHLKTKIPNLCKPPSMTKNTTGSREIVLINTIKALVNGKRIHRPTRSQQHSTKLSMTKTMTMNRDRGKQKHSSLPRRRQQEYSKPIHNDSTRIQIAGPNTWHHGSRNHADTREPNTSRRNEDTGRRTQQQNEHILLSRRAADTNAPNCN
jgi:hypothetical protein